MNSNSSSFTHTVRYAYGDLTGTIATGVESNTSWTIPLSFMNKIPSDTKGSGTIYVDTYSGSTKIGTKSCGFTATVPASVKPSVTVALDDVTGVDDLYGSPVVGLSKIKVTPTPTLAYSSPIKSTRITIDGATYTATTVTTGFLQNKGSSVVTVTVTDQRGRPGSWSYTMTVQDYNPPQIPLLAVHRTNGDWEEDDQGNHVSVTFSAEISPMGNKNQADYTLRYKKTTEDNWSTIDLSEVDQNFTLYNYAVLFEADVTASYDVELTAADRHHTTHRSTSASTAFSLMDWHHSGTGIRFGGVAELEHTFQNDLALKQTGNRYAFSTPGETSKEGFINMARIKVTAANADTPITFVLSRRQAETTMTVYVQLRNSTADTSSVQSVRYEGSNYGAYIAPGDNSLTWDLYVQKGSAWDTVTVQDWFTSRTMEDRVEVTFPNGLVDTVPMPYYRATPAVLQNILDCFMPVGFVLTLYSHADPNTMYPGTTWTRITNAFLWAVDSNGAIGTTGGSKTHSHPLGAAGHANIGFSWNSANSNMLVVKDKDQSFDATLAMAQLPGYGDNFVTKGTRAATLGGSTDSATNMPPYIQVSMWRRTA